MNKFKQIIAAMAAVTALSAAVPMSIYAESSVQDQGSQSSENPSQDKSDGTVDAAEGTSEEPAETTTETTTEPEPVFYTITFLDFDGNVMTELSVQEGEPISYDSVDTSVLRKHLDKYTEQEFSQWNTTPETAQSDLTIKALYRKAKLSFETEPSRHRYVYADGDIDTSGLKVSITVETQLPETDGAGKYKISADTIDISQSCVTKPKTLAEAFDGGKKEAVVEIIPLGDTKALASYSIELVSDIGDVTRDGKVDAVDASAILRAYAELNSDDKKQISADIMKYGDINEDGSIDAADASLVLRYYVLYSAHKAPDWRDLAEIK